MSMLIIFAVHSHAVLSDTYKPTQIKQTKIN